MHQQHHMPPTEIIAHNAQTSLANLEEHAKKTSTSIKEDGQNLIFSMVKNVEHKAHHLEQSVDNTINEKILALEKKFAEQILKNATKEELRELKEELTKKVKELEDRYSDDFKHLTHGLIYLALGAAIAIKIISLYA